MIVTVYQQAVQTDFSSTERGRAVVFTAFRSDGAMYLCTISSR